MKKEKDLKIKSRKTTSGWVSITTKNGNVFVFPAKTQKESIKNLDRFLK